MTTTPIQKILVVEDDIALLKAITEKLNRNGFLVVQADNGEKALKVASSEKPNLILLDLALPKIDGLTVLSTLRNKDAWGKAVPVIILTNMDPDKESVNQRVAEDMPSYYLRKSDWDTDEIIQKIREVIESRQEQEVKE